MLNNAGLVKNTTRARVMKAIEELKYSPNLHARSLAGGKSRSIGVIVSNIENPFFLDIYKAVEEGAHAPGTSSSWPTPITARSAWSPASG